MSFLSSKSINVRPQDIDITNRAHAEWIIDEIQGWQNLERKQRAFKDYQIATGNQKFYVRDAVQQQFPDSWQAFRLGNISLAKKVNNKKNKAYKSAPSRELETKSQTKEYAAIFKKGKFNRAFKEYDWIFNYYKYACMWVQWIANKEKSLEENARNGKYHLRALKPYEYDLIRDTTTGEPLIFIMSLPDSEVTGFTGTNNQLEELITEHQADVSAQTEHFAMWSSIHHVIVRKTTFVIIKANGEQFIEEDFEVLSMPGNEKNINPFTPHLPIAFDSKDSSSEYPTENNLADQTIDFNLGFTNLKTAADAQGHGQLVYNHAKGQGSKKIHMGMFTSIDVPLPAKEGVPLPSVEYINASPDLDGQLNVLKFDAVMILDEHDLKAKSSITGGSDKFTSGFDRLLADADCVGVIEDNQDFYAEGPEQDVYKIIKSGEETLELNTFTADEIEVKFPKPKVLISDKETISNIKAQEEQGLLMPHEKHMIMNPNLSEKAAIKREEKIQEALTAKVTAEAELQKKLFPEQNNGNMS